MEQGLPTGDDGGFNWLAVTLRSFDYSGAADAALQIAIELPEAFERGSKSGKRNGFRFKLYPRNWPAGIIKFLGAHPRWST